MRSQKHSFGLTTALAILATLFATSPPAAAQQERLLRSFGNGTDGTSPNGALISDPAGNLYGTTLNGGAYEGQAIYTGTAFELTHLKGGSWAETILHSFGGRSDGAGPAAGLIADPAANLYGTTAYGGVSAGCPSAPVGPGGCGMVFQLRPPATKGGVWTEKVLYNFTNGNDGANPQAVLTLDSSGNLYGTTFNGGGGFSTAGTVFELSPRAVGYWKIKVLHVFNSNGKDGVRPTSGLIFDSSGNLYGTTCYGGTYDGGTVFELSPKAGGGWDEKILYNFVPSIADGGCPYGGVIFDSSGNLFGTTLSGGPNNYGTVFELMPSGAAWTETVLYQFVGGSTDGYYPYAGVILDLAGNLYGDTTYGGANNVGTVFELTPTGSGWTENILHNFGSGTDGVYPYSGNLLMDAAGDLYGATTQGGSYKGSFGSGTVFEIKP
jgi:uncharacterized repeat protein (TIGR03803 family)